MKKKFKVLVPILGYLTVEVYAQDEEEATEKAYEMEFDVYELENFEVQADDMTAVEVDPTWENINVKKYIRYKRPSILGG